MSVGPIKRLSLSLAITNLARIIKINQTEKVIWENGDNIMCENAMNLALLCDPNSTINPITYCMDQEGYDALKAAVSGLVDKRTIHTTVDIQEITGFSASNSPIAQRRTMEEFMQKDCAGNYEPTEQNFKTNYDHDQIRVIHQPDSEKLMMYGWNPKLYLLNNGGSHHLACLRHIAAELGKSVPITTFMVLEALNQEAVNSFNQNYSLYLFAPSIHYSLLSDFVEAHKLPSLICSLTTTSGQKGLLFLDKSQWCPSEYAENTLNAVLTNFGNELNTLLLAQEASQQFNEYWSRHG